MNTAHVQLSVACPYHSRVVHSTRGYEATSLHSGMMLLMLRGTSRLIYSKNTTPFAFSTQQRGFCPQRSHDQSHFQNQHFAVVDVKRRC
jgi:hypothetical protein